MKTVILTGPLQRSTAKRYIDEAPEGWRMTLRENTRTLDQNAKFHALCTDIAKTGFCWMGKRRSAKAWKVLMVSGHAIATGEGAEVIGGLEGELVNIRESTATMGKSRSSSLIEYTIAKAVELGIEIRGDDE